MSTPANPTDANASAAASAAAAAAAHTGTPETAPADADAAPVDDRLKAAEAQVTILEAQKADLTDRLLRTVAEMDNIRKRLEREKNDVARYAIAKFATDIVALGDNLGHAMNSVKPELAASTPALKTLLDGIVMTDRAFVSTLERHNVKRIDPAGEPFNPHLHQAVQQERRTDVAAGTVLRVLQTGYKLDDRVLRPAAVIVAEGGAKTPKPTTDDGHGDAPPAAEPPKV
jgi:molecular chaperone GrpE